MNNLSDVVGGANLFGGSSYSFTTDRFNAPNAAIYFNQGYLEVPSGVYFSGDFTVTAWIYLKSYKYFSSILEFSNGMYSDNIDLLMYKSTSYLSAYVYKGSSEQYFETSLSSIVINLNQWYFVTFVLNSTTGYIYVNGNQIANGTLYVPNNIIRTRNYIGGTSWYLTDYNADAIYDEIKIYNIALSSSIIKDQYSISSHNSKILFIFMFIN
jgi:hypothetical protein